VAALLAGLAIFGSLHLTPSIDDAAARLDALPPLTRAAALPKFRAMKTQRLIVALCGGAGSAVFVLMAWRSSRSVANGA
jgi:hypothetical protein